MLFITVFQHLTLACGGPPFLSIVLSNIKFRSPQIMISPLSRIYTGDFFACDFLVKMNLAKLHLAYSMAALIMIIGILLMEIIVLSWFHTNIVIIENFRRESVLRQKIAVRSAPILL